MVNVDLVISYGIWISGVGMSLVGIEMTINPPNSRSKWWYRLSFIVLGLVFIGLSGLQSDRAAKEAARQTRIREEERLQDVGNTRETKGKIQGIYDVLNKLSASSDPTKATALLEKLRLLLSSPTEKLAWHWSVVKVIPDLNVEMDLLVYPTQKLPARSRVEIEFIRDLEGNPEIFTAGKKGLIGDQRVQAGGSDGLSNRLAFTTPSEIGPDAPILLKVSGHTTEDIQFVLCITCLAKETAAK